MPWQNLVASACIFLACSFCRAETSDTMQFMEVHFYGPPEAALFSRELNESLAGVLQHNCNFSTASEMEGFISSSIDGRGWTGTMWTRDAGTILRELVHWGCWDQARKSTRYLIRNVGRDSNGYYNFPEYFTPGKKADGSELDGSASIIIGFVLLWERLPADDPLRAEIYRFLHDPTSPLQMAMDQLTSQPLLAGSGEFGGGCGIPGEHVNVVQNALVRYALLASARMEDAAGDHARAGQYRHSAETIRQNLLKYMVQADGTWYWTIRPSDLKADPTINDHVINRGFGGLNGVLAMYSDVLGNELPQSDTPEILTAERTFDRLFQTPLRKQQFERYGIWTQFDAYLEGLYMSPSYGHAYALQCMLLMDKLDMAGKALKYLAEATYQPPEGYKLNRKSPYWFYERYYSPDSRGKFAWEEGCGALNIVNVAEPLKCARLMIGLDDSGTAPRVLPRLPPSWSGYEVTNLPVKTSTGMALLDLTYRQTPGSAELMFKCVGGRPISQLPVRVPQPDSQWLWKNATFSR